IRVSSYASLRRASELRPDRGRDDRPTTGRLRPRPRAETPHARSASNVAVLKSGAGRRRAGSDTWLTAPEGRPRRRTGAASVRRPSVPAPVAVLAAGEDTRRGQCGSVASGYRRRPGNGWRAPSRLLGAVFLSARRFRAGGAGAR